MCPRGFALLSGDLDFALGLRLGLGRARALVLIRATRIIVLRLVQCLGELLNMFHLLALLLPVSEHSRTKADRQRHSTRHSRQTEHTLVLTERDACSFDTYLLGKYSEHAASREVARQCQIT